MPVPGKTFIAARVQPSGSVRILYGDGGEPMEEIVAAMRDMGFDNDSLEAVGVPADLLKAARTSHHARGQMRELSGRFRRSLFRSANARAYRRLW